MEELKSRHPKSINVVIGWAKLVTFDFWKIQRSFLKNRIKNSGCN